MVILKKILFVTFNIIFFSTFNLASGNSGSPRVSLYAQDVYLEKYENNIFQGILRIDFFQDNFDYYVGLYYDDDTKSNGQITYTDQQISPLIGIQSKLLFPSFPTRLFIEARDVNRIGSFPDNRAQQDNEVRIGSLGYNFTNFGKTNFFNEYYYALFYSHLYDQKILVQGWDKIGYRLSSDYYHLDLFNELLGDSFDLTKQEQMTADFRPGMRLQMVKRHLNVQLLLQHLIPIDESGRPNENRATLVLYLTN